MLVMSPSTMTPRQTATDAMIATKRRQSIALVSTMLGMIFLTIALTLMTAPQLTSVLSAVPTSAVSIASTANAVTLTWTAPGDDANAGQAASYNLRYSTSPLTEGNFAQATAATNIPAPQVAGSTETASITGLLPSTTYYFGLKTTDDSGNISALSNIATATTSAIACVPIYQCTDWTSCLNGQQTRTCIVTNGCTAGLDAPISHQSCGTAVDPTVPAPSTPTTSPAQPPPVLVLGVGGGTSPVFRIIDPLTKRTIRQLVPFSTSDRKGLTVAVGDIDGDHQADVAVGGGAGGSSEVKLYRASGALVTSFVPYGVNGVRGVSVALADLNGDGQDELLTVPIAGAALLRVWRYAPATKRFSQIAQLYVYDRHLLNGFTVTAGDLDGNGQADIVVAPRRSGSSLTILRWQNNALQPVRKLRPYPVAFSTGVTVAIGDVDGNGRQDIIVSPGPGYYSHVKVLTISGHVQSAFVPYGVSYRQGLSLAAVDLNQDGREELLAVPYQGADTTVRVYRYSGLTSSFTRLTTLNLFPVRGVNGLRLASL